MNPEQRKSATQAILKQRGIPFIEHLPGVEPEDKVRLRTPEELLQRLVALWLVTGAAITGNFERFRNYVQHHKIDSWLSNDERAFLFPPKRWGLLATKPEQQDVIQFSWRSECLYFLAWCGGMVPRIEIPSQQSLLDSVAEYFPRGMDGPTVLQQTIRIRDKAEILDWADMLYRLHWAVRDAQLRRQPPPEGVEGGVVQEWHQAVNWMVRYLDEDNWDRVGTDT